MCNTDIISTKGRTINRTFQALNAFLCVEAINFKASQAHVTEEKEGKINKTLHYTSLCNVFVYMLHPQKDKLFMCPQIPSCSVFLSLRLSGQQPSENLEAVFMTESCRPLEFGGSSVALLYRSDLFRLTAAHTSHEHPEGRADKLTYICFLTS